ncbi:LEPR-XLL domain-containing protein [uncultured Desulfobacter sp.]|uniref:LEPR-XLL domain-containing protein n=1 Tax=uncultured Desulfobacter sp. TaxID=240139 RepID=UPI0029F4DC1B|nr:LEPR-XLL domain-containing protein [uncultured Desulfobacter sp.]
MKQRWLNKQAFWKTRAEIRRKKQQQENRFQLEQLEQRILLSADSVAGDAVVAAAMDASDNTLWIQEAQQQIDHLFKPGCV